MKEISLQQRNVVWLTIERIVKMAFSFFATSLVARKLGGESFGAISYLFGLVLITSSIANFGFDNLLLKEINFQPKSIRELVFKCFKLKLFGLSLGAVALVVFFKFSGLETLERDLIIPFLLVLFLSSFQVFEFYFLAMVQSKYSVSAYFWGGIISNFLKIIGLFLDFNIVFIGYMFLLEYLISASLLTLYFFRHTRPDQTKLISGTMIKLLKSSLPLTLASVSTMIYMKIDQVMLRNYLGLKEVGEYSAALKLSEFIYFVPVILVGSYFSKWVLMNKEGHDYLKSVDKVLTLLLIVAFSYVLGAWFLGEFIIEAVFGSEYQNSFQILKIHALSTFFVFIGVVTSKLLIIHNLEKVILYVSIMGAIFNVLLNCFLIPLYGGYGAAIATVLSQFGSGYLFLFIFKDTRKIALLLSTNFNPLKFAKNIKSIY